jgi:TorA maturation chaperone TorD
MELDFMRFLCEQEAALWRSNDAAGAARYRGIQRRFLASHLMAWAPDYCQMVLAEPCPLFAQGLAKMVSGFLANDAALLARWAEGAGGTRS